MHSRAVLVLLGLTMVIQSSVAELPGMGQSGVSGFSVGRVEDVRRVGAFMSERAKAKFREPSVGVSVVESEYVVTFKSRASPEAVTDVASQLSENPNVQLKYVGNFEHGWKGIVFKVPNQSPEDTARLLESLLLIPNVKVGEANQVITKSRPGRTTVRVRPRLTDPQNPPAGTTPTAPADPSPAKCGPLSNTDSTTTSKVSSQNWGLTRIGSHDHVLSQYEYATAGAGVNVFVVDTGVQVAHPEINGRAFAVGAGGFDAFGGDGLDSHGHGTHCSGIVAGATAGVAKKATIFSVRVLDENGSGTIGTLIDGLNFVANSNLTRRIASMSLGGGYAEALNDAVEGAVKAGVLTIVAAGNEATDACQVSPGSAPSAITVGAVNVQDTMAGFSNYGKCVDIFAPGVDIYSSVIPNSYARWSGTSMATPHVAGVAARLWGKGVCNTAAECADALKCLGTTGLAKGITEDSPNVMLYIPPGV